MESKPTSVEGGETPPNPDDVIAKVLERKVAELRSAVDAPSAVVADVALPPAPQATPKELDIDAQLAGQRLTMFGFDKEDAKKACKPFVLQTTEPQVVSPDPQIAQLPSVPVTTVVTEVLPVSADPITPSVFGGEVKQAAPKSRETARFKLPRMGKVATLKFRAADGSVFEIQKKPGGYRITKEGEPGISSISKTSIEQRGQAGGWVLLKQGSGVVGAEPHVQEPSPDAVATPKADPNEPDAATTVPQVEPLPQLPVVPQAEPLLTPEPLPILKGVDIAAALVLLDNGNKLAYRRANGSDVLVKKKSDQYWVSEKDDSGFVTVGALGLEEIAEREGWQSVEVPTPSGAQGEAKPDVAEQDAKIARLREVVNTARTAFITAEESQGSTWKKLMQTFRTLKHRESDDREVQVYHNAYDQAVLALQEAELEKLKQSSLSLQQLRPEMAALIREFQFDEAERIYTERRQQRLEKTNQSLGEKLDARWEETVGSLEAESGKGEKWKQYIKYFLGASATLGKAAVQGVEKLGQANNEFSKKYGKYILTATVTVGGAVALGAATGGVASAALGALALKRLAAGAGLAVAAEAGMDKYAASRREKKRANVETDQAGFFQKMEDAVETREVEAIATGKEGDGKLDLSLLEAFLKDEAAKARKGEGARRRNALLRKSGAIFAGAVLGSGAVSHFAHGFFVDTPDAAAIPQDVIATDARPSAAAPLSEAAPFVEQAPASAVSSGPTGGITVVDSPVPLVGSASMPSDIAGAASAAATVEHGTGMSAKVTDFLSTYEVKRGDNIWQLAEKAVKGVPGMEGRHSNRFAKLVELKLQEKLESSPELARAAGFVSDANGKFSVHAIQAGTKLELGKLISAEDMAKLVEEAKGDAPIRVAAASLEAPTGSVPVDPLGQGLSLEAKEHGLSLDQVSGEGLRAERGVKVALNAKSLEPAQITVVPEEAVDGVVELRPEAALTRPDGQVMDYVGNLSREEQEHLFQNFRKLSAALFETDEVMNAEGYDRSFNPIPHAELAKTKLADILADHKALSRNPVFMYDRMKNPLHWSQMQEIDRLAKASAKVFGEEIARARNGESIQEYVLRVVALAGHEGKKIPGFRMLH